MFRPLMSAGLWLVALAACVALASTVGEALAGPAIADMSPGSVAHDIAFSATPKGLLVRY